MGERCESVDRPCCPESSEGFDGGRTDEEIGVLAQVEDPFDVLNSADDSEPCHEFGATSR